MTGADGSTLCLTCLGIQHTQVVIALLCFVNRGGVAGKLWHVVFAVYVCGCVLSPSSVLMHLLFHLTFLSIALGFSSASVRPSLSLMRRLTWQLTVGLEKKERGEGWGDNGRAYGNRVRYHVCTQSKSRLVPNLWQSQQTTGQRINGSTAWPCSMTLSHKCSFHLHNHVITIK